MFAELKQEFSKFWKEEIRLQLGAAKQNCALFGTLWVTALSAERPIEILGQADQGPSPEYLEFMGIVCAGMANCIAEARRHCEQEGGSTTRQSELLTLERTRQIPGLGDDCGKVTEEDLEKGAPKWSGTITLTECDRTETSEDGKIDKQGLQYESKGFVDTAFEVGAGDLLDLTFTIKAQAQGHQLS